jgi:ubiquitin-protein ligase
MSNISNLRRIINETKKLKTDENDNSVYFKVSQVGDNMYHWEGQVYGPIDSLYQDYGYKVDIELPADYPQSALKIKFITPMQHVNVNKDGNICMDILKDKWTSTQCISSILISLASLLRDPNTTDPFNPDLADLYEKDKKEYEKKIRNFCKRHGIPHKTKQVVSI